MLLDYISAAMKLSYFKVYMYWFKTQWNEFSFNFSHHFIGVFRLTARRSYFIANLK